MKVRERKAALVELGFTNATRSTRDYRLAVKGFKRGYNLGPRNFGMGGLCGRKCQAALKVSLNRKRRGLPDASANFSFREFACKCGGRYASCRRVFVRRVLLRRLEKYRAKNGNRPIVITSGYRCPGHNKAVGGASKSQHMDGRAADIPPQVPVSRVASWRLFTGIGRHRSGNASHVDVRKGPSLSAPVRWNY